MKTIIILVFLAFIASLCLAQDQIYQQFPQVDTTSGWTLVFSKPNYSIDRLQFFPENTVYAVASNKSFLILMRSSDRGISWDTLSTPIPTGYVFFTSATTGYSSSDDPLIKYVWKTTDGGSSWQQHDRNSIATGPLRFADNDTGIIMAPSTTARTTDGGGTWKEIHSIADIVKLDGAFVNSKVGYGVGEAVGIFPHSVAGWCQKTTDGGATWTFVYTGIPEDISCCKVLNEKTVIVACRRYFVGRTTDGGNTWDSTKLVSRSSEFNGMSFADKGHGIIVGDDDNTGINPHGIIYATSDTGKTWQKQYSPIESSFSSVVMIDDNIAIITGDSGRIYRTTNGGNFSSVNEHTIDFQVQTYPNPTTGNVTIQYTLPSTQSVSINFYTVQGTLGGAISSGIQNAGTQQATFDGSALPNGVYYFRLITPQDFYVGSFTIQK